MALPDCIEIGGLYRFNYPSEFVTLPGYTAHAGCLVRVVRQLTADEADQADDMERMFRVRALKDGWTGDVWASELI